MEQTPVIESLLKREKCRIHKKKKIKIKNRTTTWTTHNNVFEENPVKAAPRAELKKKCCNASVWRRWGRPIALICCESGGMEWLGLTQRGGNCNSMFFFLVLFPPKELWRKPLLSSKNISVRLALSLACFLTCCLYSFRFFNDVVSRKEGGVGQKSCNIISIVIFTRFFFFLLSESHDGCNWITTIL